MQEDVKTLRLADMLFRRRGTFAQHVAHFIISIALRLFFRRIETSGAQMVPPDGPVIFVLNHPNGLIDPGLVFTALPRRISFLAKSTLFRLPLIGALLRAVETLPLYRRVDEGEDLRLTRMVQGRASFDSTSTVVSSSSTSARGDSSRDRATRRALR
jgi:1-acyl-sn-glycerol-3-phosphate acyltransferase